MNFRTITNELHAPIKGVRVMFERENGALTRVYLTTETGDVFCIKLAKPGDCLEMLRRADPRPVNEPITAETEEPANTSPAA